MYTEKHLKSLISCLVFAKVLKIKERRWRTRADSSWFLQSAANVLLFARSRGLFFLVPISNWSGDSCEAAVLRLHLADREASSVRSHQSPCGVTQADKDAAEEDRPLSGGGGGEGTRLATNMAHLFWHSDGILDLKRELRIY